MRKKLTAKQIWKVLHADLIGKDSQRGITLTYGWMANQIGHFALGFIPSFILSIQLENVYLSSIYVSTFWLIFEIYNALSPLYKKEYKGNGSFKPAWKNLIFDTFTDLTFFWLGAISFSLLSWFDINLLLFSIPLFLFISFAIRYWFLTKLFQQTAKFPYQFRLSQWDGEIKKVAIDKINNFVQSNKKGDHYVIIGEARTGKTRLSVGMANEKSIKKNICTYTTLTKWVTLLSESNEQLKNNLYGLEFWRNVNTLVIDDINPGNPKEANLYSAEMIKNLIVKNYAPINIHALLNTNVIWVVGETHKEDTTDNWVDMLISIGINSKSIHLIQL